MWQVKSTRTAFDNKWWQIKEEEVVLPSGKEIKYYVRERLGAAITFPLTKGNQVVLLDQYRHAKRSRFMEFPAGTIEQGQTPEENAEAELQEETGYVSSSIKKMAEIPFSPGYETGLIHFFVATECSREKETNHEATEDIKVLTMPMAEYKRKLLSGQIKHGVCDRLAGFMALNYLGELK